MQADPRERRPARPARCVIDAWLMRCVTSRVRPVRGSKRATRSWALSTTRRILDGQTGLGNIGGQHHFALPGRRREDRFALLA
jgi:hypothetical protein